MGAGNDAVLWSSLFCMAGLARKPDAPQQLPGNFPLAAQRAISQALALGLLPVLTNCAAEYQARVAQRSGEADELIQGAGGYLLRALREEKDKLQARRVRWRRVAATSLLCTGVAVAAWWGWGRRSACAAEQ